ncbi:MAG TPA: pitrilysin family protein, partial [Chitinophagaceae bacterium]|nr:pitrilysin family protein [Chitinophagaceae bacterium]
LDSSCHHEHGNYALHSLTRHIGELLPLLREIITTPVFPQEELDLYRQNMKQQLAVNLRKCDFVANRKIDECLFGTSHPYGSFSSMEAYDALNRESLVQFYRSHYTFDRCRIFAAGQLPPDFALQLNRHFGKDSWNGPSSSVRPTHNLLPAGQRSYRIQNDPEGVQGAVRMGRLFPNRFHPDFPGMRVLNTIFGGYFGSRLMSNIREEKGFTYGIHSHLYNCREQSAITIQTEAGREVCESTLTEIYKEMNRIRQEPVEEEELHLVRNYLMGSVLGDLDGPFQLIQRWRDLILNGLDETYFNKNIETVRTITAEELLVLARKYFVAEEWYELIVI